MTLFGDKYRVESTRLKNWDYSSNGAYYLTICEKNRACVFGYIETDKIILSALGKKAEQCWLDIPNHFPFVKLDAFVIMPNHIHGILIINKPVETQHLASPLNASLEETEHNETKKNNFGRQSQNIGSIIRGFKIGVTLYAKENLINFAWQARFYDHVIRNEEDLFNIRQYIINNPKNWKEDEFHQGQK